jgi:hypothetical protein
MTAFEKSKQNQHHAHHNVKECLEKAIGAIQLA